MPRPPAARSPHPAVAAAIALAATLLAVVGSPALAKEGLEARLDAPIGMDTPAGTVIRVGITVTAPGENGPLPVMGTPVYLKLTGADGSTTREAAAGEDYESGHYHADIAIPGGGARRVEIGIHGTSDLAIIVVGETLVFGGITRRTAQVAPPAMTPFPRAVTPAVEPAPPVAEPAPAAPAAAAPAPFAGAALLVPGGLALAAGAITVAVGLGIAARRRRMRAA